MDLCQPDAQTGRVCGGRSDVCTFTVTSFSMATGEYEHEFSCGCNDNDADDDGPAITFKRFVLALEEPALTILQLAIECNQPSR